MRDLIGCVGCLFYVILAIFSLGLLMFSLIEMSL